MKTIYSSVLSVAFYITAYLMTASIILAEEAIPMGSDYRGPKCIISVGDFAMLVEGAPEEFSEGIKEMMQTALFESNHFIVVERKDPAGISADKLLSDSFLKEGYQILEQEQIHTADLLIYGAITALEAEGTGIRVKIPGAPIKLGGKYHKARITIAFRIFDIAEGRTIAEKSIKGTALSGGGSVSAFGSTNNLPLVLEAVRNTPLELAIRDCIYRSVISLRSEIPSYFFRYQNE